MIARTFGAIELHAVRLSSPHRCAIYLAIGILALIAETARAAENSAWRKPASVTWSGAPLRDSLRRFAEAQSLHIVVDRRVDPGAPLELAADRLPAEEIVRSAAEKHGAAISVLDGVAYVGPKAACRRLATVAALRTQEAQKAPAALRKKLLERSAWKWDDFAEPRQLLQQLAGASAVTIDGAERIPHDLWAAAELPPLTLAERLTVLLHQFDLTYRIGDDGETLIVEPLPERVAIERSYPASAKPEQRLADWRRRAPEAAIELQGERIVVRGTMEDHAALTAPERPTPRAPEPPEATQVYTLKVDGQPLNKLLPPLARQLQLELVIDEPAIAARGVPVNYRVTFEVKEATLKQLLDAVFQGTQLAWRVENGKLTVTAP